MIQKTRGVTNAEASDPPMRPRRALTKSPGSSSTSPSGRASPPCPTAGLICQPSPENASFIPRGGAVRLFGPGLGFLRLADDWQRIFHFVANYGFYLHRFAPRGKNGRVAERLDSVVFAGFFRLRCQLSSVVEQRFRKAWVLGSIPRAGSIKTSIKPL